jgi:hypothetical protein
LNSAHAREAVKHGDPPSEALVEIAKIIKRLRLIRQNDNLIPPKQVTGRVANVAIWEKRQWEFINGFISVGTFIRLRNVTDSKMSLVPGHDFRCLHVSVKSSLTPLPNLTYEVVHLLEEHNNRLLRREPTNPDSGILPLDTESNFDSAQASHHDDQLHASGDKQSSQQRKNSAQQACGTNSTRTSSSPTKCARLEDLLAGPVPLTFEGPIRITALYPPLSVLSSDGMERVCPLKDDGSRNYEFGLRIEAESSAVLDVVTGESAVGQVVFGMSEASALANESGALCSGHTFLAEQRPRTARIKSVVCHGEKYFVLLSLGERSNLLLQPGTHEGI